MQFSKLFLAAGIALGTIAATQTLATTAAFAQDMYGAIATSDASDWGYGYNYPTQAQAEAAALQQCGTGGCTVRVWFKNACGAVAENNNVVGWGWGDSESEAKAQAVSSCGSGDCKILTWACTDR
jgi:Domain of unknown function (DUF4189)